MSRSTSKERTGQRSNGSTSQSRLKPPSKSTVERSRTTPKPTESNKRKDENLRVKPNESPKPKRTTSKEPAKRSSTTVTAPSRVAAKSSTLRTSAAAKPTTSKNYKPKNEAPTPIAQQAGRRASHHSYDDDFDEETISQPPRNGASTAKIQSSSSTSKNRESNISVSNSRSHQPIQHPPTPPQDEYEDDFEDYEDDFEDEGGDSAPQSHRTPVEVADSPSSMDVVMQRPENAESVLLKRIATSHGRRELMESPDYSNGFSASPARPTTSASRTLNLSNLSSPAPDPEVIAKSNEEFERLKIGSQLQRSAVLSVDMPPNRRLDMFNRFIDQSAAQLQRHTQTGEDNMESGVQTDSADYADEWTQFPVGRVEVPSLSRSRKEVETSTPQRQSIPKGAAIQSDRFFRFLDISAQVFISLARAAQIPTVSADFYLPMRSRLEFSTGYASLSLGVIAKDSVAVGVAVNPKWRDRLLFGFYIRDAADRYFVNKTLLAEFQLSDLNVPLNVLIANNEVSDFAYSADGQSAAFAGMRDGSALLWDLNESAAAAFHQFRIRWPDSPAEIHTRLPAYDTSFEALEAVKRKQLGNEESPVVAVGAVGSSRAQPQFLSLSAAGVCTIFAATRQSSAAGFHTDFGLRPGATLRLVALTTLHLTAAPDRLRPEAAIALALSPTNGNLFGCATSRSRAVVVDREQVEAMTRVTLAGEPDEGGGAAATAICFANPDTEFFAVGSSDGRIQLHRVGHRPPLLILPPPANCRSVSHLLWSPSHSQLLIAVYDSHRLGFWDLEAAAQRLRGVTNGVAAGRLEPPRLVDVAADFQAPISRCIVWRDERGLAFGGFTLQGTNEILIHGLERVHQSSKSLTQFL